MGVTRRQPGAPRLARAGPRPQSAPFSDVVKVARTLHQILESLELPSFVKTSGKTGLHILLPLEARYSYEQTRTFARLLATLGVEAEPHISTVARPLHARGGEVYIDWGQNGQGQTVVAPFSVRPLRGAPICPLAWAEVTPGLDPLAFTIKTAARLQQVGDSSAPVLKDGLDLAAALQRIQRLKGDGPSRPAADAEATQAASRASNRLAKAGPAPRPRA